MHLWWGPELINLYNDAHIPVLGKRHPHALGQSAPRVWSEVWPLLKLQVDAVMSRGESTWNEHARRPGAQRLSRRRLVHLVLQPGPRRVGPDQGPDVHRHRGHRAGSGRAGPRPPRSRSGRQSTPPSGPNSPPSSNPPTTPFSPRPSTASSPPGTRGPPSRIFGYSAAEAVGKPILLLIPPERRHEETEIQQRLAGGQRVNHFETVRIAKDGRKIDVSLTVSPIRNAAGQIVGASKIVRDITARKKAEEALARQSEELARSNVELERFAYVASHDLQEPMRTVQSFAGLLIRRHGEHLKGEAQEFLQFVTQGVQRMQALINDLLAYSRVNSQGAAFARADCNQIMAKVLENLRASIDAEQAHIMVDALPTVLGDATQLGQVFQNLLGNALKFRGKEPPRIRVAAERKAGQWVFSVSDNGIGIEAQYFERIFIIFQRLHTIEEYGGTGIGLAICKKIVERHGGRIWLESKPGQGSTFFFSVPDRNTTP